MVGPSDLVIALKCRCRDFRTIRTLSFFLRLGVYFICSMPKKFLVSARKVVCVLANMRCLMMRQLPAVFELELKREGTGTPKRDVPTLDDNMLAIIRRGSLRTMYLNK